MFVTREGSGNTTQYDLGFVIPTEASLDDFSWTNQSVKNSEEAKAAGIQGSDTFDRLLKAIDDVDPTVKAHATMVLAGIEDTAGNWTEAENPVPVELTGIFYPDGCLVRLDDPEGNQYGAHAFVVCGDEEHAVGAYYDKKRDPILSGAIFMTRKRQ